MMMGKSKRNLFLVAIFLCSPLLVGHRIAQGAGVRGLEGAIKIPIKVDSSCQATLVICNEQDQVVRILAQVIPLSAGTTDVLWDGMDLWGELVPAGTSLKLKVITNQQVRAIYEMAVGSSGNPAWLTGRTGEGDAMRQGGNLGDHSGPSSVATVGDRVFFGSTVVEHGHNLIATNSAGEKMWGIQLKGWDGPEQLTTDGQTLFALAKGKKDVYAIDSASFAVKKLFSVSEQTIETFAATRDKLILVLNNPQATADPFARAKLDIDFAKTLPATDSKKAPEFQLTSQQRLETVFGTGGHFQTGFSLTMADATTGQAVIVFKNEVDIGSLMVGQIEGAAEAQYFALKPGGSINDPGAANPSSEPWQLIAQTTFPRPVDVLTIKDKAVKTRALLMRVNLPKSPKKPPLVTMCRIQPQRVQRVDSSIKVILPTTAQPNSESKKSIIPKGATCSWDVRTDLPVTEAEPVTVTLDLGKAVSLRGISLLNCINPEIEVLALTGEGSPDSADENRWRSLVKHSARHDKRSGYSSGRVNFADRTIAFPEEVTTRALRLKFTQGVMPTRGPRQVDEDPNRVACGEVTLLQLIDPPVEVPHQFLQVRDLKGDILQESINTDLVLKRIACDLSNGETLYGITENALMKLSLSASSLTAKPIANDLGKPVSITAANSRVAVGDDQHRAVFVFDASGKKLVTIGNKGPYTRGPFDPGKLNRASGVAFAKDNSIWVVEDAYHPKRMAHFSAAGDPIRDLWGPPEYGGGGYLDPNLKSFYYRGMEFGIDWPTGKWHLRGFNDRYASHETPTTDESSFKYTSAGRVITFNNRKYAVDDPGGDVVICLLENGVWKPAAVMGMASANPFLLGKSIWRDHWLRQNLKETAFIWCDQNGDGAYQIEEVELFNFKGKGFVGGAYWGSKIGRDLTIFSTTLRLAPTRITSAGVPIYESKQIQEFKYDALAPVFKGNMIIGSLAKKDYGAATMVAEDGSLIVEGQPYRVGPDLQLVGGPVQRSKSTDAPPIAGLVMDNPLGFMGSISTQSPLGEVAMMNGVNGPWFLWSAKHGCVVGRIFTGAKGGWSSLANVRGTDVTEYKQDWECFFGSVDRASDGKCYAVVGKGHHAICRLDGLDDFRVQEYPIRVTAETVAANLELRPKIFERIRQKKESASAARAEFAVAKSAVTVDGDLNEWSKSLTPLHTPSEASEDSTSEGALAHDDERLFLAFRGRGVLKNSADDPKFLFKSGFCFDLAIRTNAKSKEKRIDAGDKRLLVGLVKGKWTAVLLDYVNKEAGDASVMEYTSPVATTRVARVTVLTSKDFSFAIKKKSAGGAGDDYTAEISVSFDALGMNGKPSGALPGDFGILQADPTGLMLAHRAYWSNPDTEAITDMAAEAAIQPATFGLFQFGK